MRESSTKRSYTTTYKLARHLAHDCEEMATVNAGVGDTGMDAASTIYALKELLGCKAKRAKY